MELSGGEGGRWLIGIASAFVLCVRAGAASYVVAWGDLDQSDVPTSLAGVTAVACGRFHDIVLQEGGMPDIWGAASFQVPVHLSGLSSIAAGTGYCLALTTGGQVVAWGDNSYGQTNVPPSLSGVVAIAAGAYHGLALRGDGSVTGWGDNSNGQATPPESLSNVAALGAEFYHSLALSQDGEVTAWGDDSFGQATPPEGLCNVVGIAAGGDHCLALTMEGRVVAWGDDTFGQTDVPPDLTNAVAVAGGDYHSVALRADRTVVSWGLSYNGATLIPEGLTNVAVIAAGGSHNLALVQDSAPMMTLPVVQETALCGSTVVLRAPATEDALLGVQWWFNGEAMPASTRAVVTMENVQTNQTGIYFMAVSNACGLVASGETELWVVPSIITNQPTGLAVRLGDTAEFCVGAESLAPASYQWLFNGAPVAGATNSVLTLNDVGGARDGAYCVIISNSYGTVTSSIVDLTVTVVEGWGASYGMPATNLNTPAHLGALMAIAEGKTSDVVAVIRTDGMVTNWPEAGGPVVNPPPDDLPSAIGLAVAWGTYLTLRGNGGVDVWGWGEGPTNVPTGLSGIVAIAAGDFHALALRFDGTVAAWGMGYDGSTNVPAGLSNVVAVSAAYDHSLALTADGEVISWGLSYGGQPAFGPGLSSVVGISAGGDHAVALLGDGTVVAWGDNEFGQTNVPPGLSNVVEIVAGFSHSLALKADGTVVAWGDSQQGQTNVPAGLSNVVALAAGYLTSFALLGNARPVVREELTDPKWTESGFQVSVATQVGRVYRLEYKESLGEKAWAALPLVAGNGGLLILSDPTPAGADNRFYRVRRW